MASDFTAPQTGRHQPKPSNNKRKVDADSTFQRRKKKKPNPFEGGVARPKKHSIAPLKTRIRDLRRQLARLENLTADVRVAKERELAACERELESEQMEKQRQEMIGKYHMVRFFDRRKAERRLKKAKRALAQVETADVTSAKEVVARCRAEVREKETEVAYAQYYPLAMKYESLFPKAKSKSEQAEDDEEKEEPERKGNQEMWNRVKIALEKGQEELVALRESDAPAVIKEMKDDNSQHGRKRKGQKGLSQAPLQEEEEEVSDGGFFE